MNPLAKPFVSLTNCPDTERQLRGPSHGPEIYAFYREEWRHLYDRLPLPEISKGECPGSLEKSLPLSWGVESAMRHCWVKSTVTDFSPGSSWPFDGTMVYDRDSSSYPSDRGQLDPEDLGDEVARVLALTPTSSVPREVASVAEPEITHTRTIKYRLAPSEPVKKALCEW